MSVLKKPIHQYFNQRRYISHRNMLDSIEKERSQVQTSNILEEVHKIRNQAQNFHLLQHENEITSSNQKLLKKLLSISKRKKSQYSQTIHHPKIITFDNPARKKREKMITQMNQQMADRMLHRNSQLDHKIMKKSMDEYVKIKKTITNNKRALSVSRVTGPLPTISLNRSTKKVILKQKSILIKYEESLEDNPEFIKKID